MEGSVLNYQKLSKYLMKRNCIVSYSNKKRIKLSYIYRLITANNCGASGASNPSSEPKGCMRKSLC
ncbi:hypothetical protein BpHYR1_014576 [Brachionus plicatilis]|uniref:Uncharacterized protein n=1 Tax=Brachionus plicatilis TaxID=10195 RepID=A0A3M7RM85_BRAPC|nr:hypothetical protein BpHYR1_014576 [Brachionus plicatilis]